MLRFLAENLQNYRKSATKLGFFHCLGILISAIIILGEFPY